MQQLYASGTQHLMQIYFQAATFAGPFYIGLGTGAIPSGVVKTLADITEVEGDGYARIEVARTNDADTGWTLNGGIVQSPVLTFTNSNVDPSVAWTDADYCFLTLSPSGTSSPAVLLGAIEMDTVVLTGTQSESIVFTFSLFS